MNGPKIGELFAGYGGLGMGVQQVYGGEVVWVSEFDKGPSKILAHRFPGVPNHGDITAVQWLPICGEAEELPGCGRPMPIAADRKGWECNRCQKYWSVSLGQVYWPHVPEPVDILTGGSPCQDLSHAGARAGMTEGTRSNLWVAMREAIAQLRPSLVVWENVGGAFSAAADSEVEPCAGCVGDGSGVHLRALGRVLGDLSSLGYDASWHSLRASDVVAPHGRLRVFVVATDTANVGHERPWATRHGWTGPADGGFADVKLLPTATTRDHKDHAIRREPHRPDDTDMGEGKTVERWDEWTADMQAKHGNGNGHGKSLAIEAQRLLPTPMAGDAKAARNSTATRHKIPPTGVHAGDTLSDITYAERWGDYAAAIARWEHVLGRPAPEPTMTSSKGNPQLSPRFVEWMMGLPDGWVTDVPGITRNEALKALGNGVVPQQAAEALRVMASWGEVAA